MLLFEFDNGNLIPAQFGASTGGEIDADVMVAVRDHVLQIIGKPLFPVQWDAQSHGAHAAQGDPDSLVAMDASGQVVTVEVRRVLDSRTLVAALAHSGQTSTLGWLDLANLYPSGTGAFRRDWNAFRESLPPRPLPGARLYVVTGKILDEVRPALELLADSGVEVFEVAQRNVSDGRMFVEVTEPYRISVPTISQHATLESAHRPVIEAESALRGISPDDLDDDASAIDETLPDSAAEPRSAAVAETASEPVQIPVTATADESAVAQPIPALGAEVPEAQVESPPRSRPSLGHVADFEESVLGVVLEDPNPSLMAFAASSGRDVPLVWVQLRKGLRHEAAVTRDGLITLDDGRQFADPSDAAVAASGRHAADGWRVWRVGGEGGPTLHDVVTAKE